MRKMRSYINYLLLILMSVWFVIAFLRTSYNVLKIYTEEKAWISLSDEEKRNKIFGDLHTFFRFVQRNTKEGSRILFLSPGGKTYYVGLYYLYPTKIIYVKNIIEARELMKKNKFNYLLVYQTREKDLDENESFSWQINELKSSSTYMGIGKKSIGRLYKL